MGKKDKKTENKPVKKSSIIIAWIILIILIILTIVLTYIKFFWPNENIEKYPIEESNNSNANLETTPSLEQIVSNFNQNSLSEEYKSNGITMNASLTENVLTIEYKKTTSNVYQFIFYNPNLTITIDNNTPEEFYDVYKALTYAVQETLGNTTNIDNYINNFINNNEEVEGLNKEIIENTTKYSIDISKAIKETVTNKIETIEPPMIEDEIIDDNNNSNNVTNNIEGAE